MGCTYVLAWRVVLFLYQGFSKEVYVDASIQVGLVVV